MKARQVRVQSGLERVPCHFGLDGSVCSVRSGLYGVCKKRLTLPDTTEGGFIPDDLKILHFVGLAGLAWSKNSPKALKKFDRIMDFCRTRNQSGNVLEFWQAAR
ncbi:hypothetical protein COO20_17335 [Thalassospira marina]|uniref:Uncharacterized protein n=1 Tax=Thalassospira marina TaxID=2048283 RepID=A0A2N3KMW1_9PROT|nr:hypothetical protein COO20_17335 [Thalassospira marina]